MSIARSPTTKTSFLCIAFLASSKSRPRHHFAWKIKSLATASTKFSASSLTLNQSFPHPSFTRQETSNWQLKHRNLHSSQMKSNREVYVCNHNEMDHVVSDNFPKFSDKGSHEITNSSDYTKFENGIMYADIRPGKGENGIEMGRKFVIDYKLFNVEKEYINGEGQKETTLEKLGTGLREGIKGMMSQGRRLIIVPLDLDDHQVNKGKYAIYDVTIKKIHRDHWFKRLFIRWW